ncbi:MAG: calcium/sodium antiporter [Candidatus Nomurabacteria bacterium]|nr:calcium/sodium antiporter [Candidatus Nomurabacteria bacterium]
MAIFISLLLTIGGLALLAKMTDIFVDGASSIAKHLRVSATVIGLTIVAFGTSAPEFFIALTSRISGSGSTDIAMGNIVGSGVLRILLILGLAAVIRPIRVQSAVSKRELPLLILTTCAFVATFLDQILDSAAANAFSRIDAIMMLLIFGIFIYYLRMIILHRRAIQDVDNIDAIADARFTKKQAIFAVIGGLIGLIIGAQLTVAGATAVAEGLGMSERVIAITIIGIGTSLPELLVAAVAAKRGEGTLAIGSIIGANIFNIGFVIALPTLIFGGFSVASFSYVDLGMMLIAVFLLALFSTSDRKIQRSEGLAMLIIFTLYMIYLII